MTKKYAGELDGFSVDAFAVDHPADVDELVEVVEST